MSDGKGIDGPLTARQLMWILWGPAALAAAIYLWIVLVAQPQERAAQAVAYLTVNNADEVAGRLEAMAENIDALPDTTTKATR